MHSPASGLLSPQLLAAARSRIPGGLLTAKRRPSPTSGFGLCLSLVPALDALLGSPTSRARLRELIDLQGAVFAWLQQIDDVIDGQSQTGSTPAGTLAPIEARLARLLPHGTPFWKAWKSLVAEQEESWLWEERHRKQPLVPFNRALLRRLGSKAALLRWPAFALVQLACEPGRARSLDAVAARLLTAAILFDDLTDLEEDFERRQVNALLCAGHIRSNRDAYTFYPAVARGAHRVCRAGIAELEPLRRAHPRTPLDAACATLQRHFEELARATLIRCQARTMASVLGQLSNP